MFFRVSCRVPGKVIVNARRLEFLTFQSLSRHESCRGALNRQGGRWCGLGIDGSPMVVGWWSYKESRMHLVARHDVTHETFAHVLFAIKQEIATESVGDNGRRGSVLKLDKGKSARI